MQILVIDARGAIPVYQQIVDQIRERVREGALLAGTPLPSVRQLAFDLGVNANTVAKAYMLLERDGILQTIRRRGTFVAAQAQERASLAVDQRIEDAVGRVLDEIASLGVDEAQIIEILKRRLRPDSSSGSTREGGDK